MSKHKNKMSVENILVKVEIFDVPQGGKILRGHEIKSSDTEMCFSKFGKKSDEKNRTVNEFIFQ